MSYTGQDPKGFNGHVALKMSSGGALARGGSRRGAEPGMVPTPVAVRAGSARGSASVQDTLGLFTRSSFARGRHVVVP